MKEFIESVPNLVWILLVVILVVISIIITIIKTSGKRAKRNRMLKRCQSSSDINYRLQESEARILKELAKNRSEIQRALKLSNQRIDTEWMDSCERVITVASILQQNIEHQKKSRLQASKFHTYTNLWFRSMLAADLVHDEFVDINKSYDEINKLILSLKGKKGGYIDTIHKSKDLMKKGRQLVLNKLHELNHNTGEWRDKIGHECGEGGRKWAEARKANAKSKSYR